jgi:hypothetical protein
MEQYGVVWGSEDTAETALYGVFRGVLKDKRGIYSSR